MKRSNITALLSALVMLLTSSICSAGTLTLETPLISDSMVIQRDASLPLWGKAAPGAQIYVQLGNQKKQTQATDQGIWNITLDPIHAGVDLSLVLSADKEQICFRNICIGEVWVCSGQSNMMLPMTAVLNADTEIANATNQDVRLFAVPVKSPLTPWEHCDGQWEVCAPESVTSFGATAYFFARELQSQLDVPVGVIMAAVSGSAIELWTPWELLEANEQYRQHPFHNEKILGCYYNGMIAPLHKFPIKGIIWYQGEGNHRRPQSYFTIFRDMISWWRMQWQMPDMPFLYVQLANYLYPQKEPVEKTGWPYIREAQLQALALPNTAMAVAIDIGEEDIHPQNKQAVGRRLSLCALNKAYEKTIACTGPIYKDMEVQENTIKISFSHADGLYAKGGKVTGFAIAGDDRKFQWANAEIRGTSVYVSHPEISNPAAVRYGWANNPPCVLYNNAGLPASPFRTDTWQQPEK